MSILVGLEITDFRLVAVAVDAESGGVVASARRSLASTTAPDGRAEQPVEDVLIAVAEALAELGSSGPWRGSVAAVGVAGDPRSTLLVGASLEPLRDILLSRDVRHLSIGPSTLARLAWLGGQEANLLDGVRHVLSPKDYVGLWLTGELATDPGTLGVSGAYDAATLTPDLRALDAHGAFIGWFPPVAESPALLGRVSEEAATRTSLPIGTPVVVGGTLAAAAAIASGVVRQGRALLALDPGGLVAMTLDEVTAGADPSGPLVRHAVPGRFCAHREVSGSAGMWDWYRSILCDGERLAAELRSEDISTIVLEAASTSRPGASGLSFVPPATLVGLAPTATKADVSRAFVEGVTIDAICALDGLDARRGPPRAKNGNGASHAATELRVAGRVARNAFWRQLAANVAGRPAHATTQEGAAYGAAVIAAVASGAYGSIEEAADAMVYVTARSVPDPTTAARYADLRAAFEAVTDRIAPIDALVSPLR